MEVIQIGNLWGEDTEFNNKTSGRVYDKDGISTEEKINFMLEMRSSGRDKVKDYADKFGVAYFEGKRPWEVKCDCAFPCATQNELNGEEAKMLLANGVKLVAEGANMPSTAEAVSAFLEAKILYAPGKASNAGGVATSGLEMSQNSERLSWSAEEVDTKLKGIMKNIHDAAYEAAAKFGMEGNYVAGANISNNFSFVEESVSAYGRNVITSAYFEIA